MGDEGIDKSGYNEAAFKMARIDECQKKINYVNGNLLAFYYEFNGYGYVIKRTEMSNLISEVWGKMDPPNKKKIMQYQNLIDEAFKVYPVHIQKKISNFEGSNKNSKINPTNYIKITQLLFNVHMYINELLEAAGYSTFTIDADDANDPYN